MGIIGALVFLIVFVTPLAVGIALMISARRGGLGFPACGACRYNLSATVGTAVRCPECGAAFTQVGILPPRGPRRPWRLWGGLALTILPFCLFIVLTMVTMQMVNTARARGAAIRAQQQQQQLQQQQPQTPPMADEGADGVKPAAEPDIGDASE